METIQLNVNGEDYNVTVKKNWTLLYVLRELLNLTGTKEGCSTGDCGACKVLIDSEPVNSCVYPAIKAIGKKVITIEGFAEGTKLHPIQQAFIDAGAVQCGFCTPGMVISAKAILDKNANPTREEIAQSLDNNLCRCTGYAKIIDAIQLAAKAMGGGSDE